MYFCAKHLHIIVVWRKYDGDNMYTRDSSKVLAYGLFSFFEGLYCLISELKNENSKK